MVDALYIRGWDDCLEAVWVMMKQTENIDDVRKRIEKLRELIRESKFEKIRHELGTFGLF